MPNKKTNKRRLLVLLKFGKRNYLETILNEGILHMKRLRLFQDIEHSQIGDKNEGLSQIWQPNQIILEINGTKLEHLAGPVKIVENNNFDPHIFCMYAITDKHIKKDTGTYIDEKCLEFGDSVLVIRDGQEFINRILKEHKNTGGKITLDLVKYVPYDTHHGEMGAFRKFDYHSHQSEYRLVYENNIKDDVINFNIGNIEDIAEILPSNEINNLIEIKSNA